MDRTATNIMLKASALPASKGGNALVSMSSS